jgi:DMSO reductase iron-sulfur subunit
MSQYTIFQDKERCIGCMGCQVHCKVDKSLPEGPRPCQIVTVGPKMDRGEPKVDFVYLSCFHCEKAWCVSACPTGAMRRREKDGIVFVDEEQCVGCKACMVACPWGAPQWNPKTNKVVKCDLCMDRLDEGLEPACVARCTAKCLHFGKAEEVQPLKRLRAAMNISTSTGRHRARR